MSNEKYIKGTEFYHTHLKFYYRKHSMIVNKYTYKHVYPNAKASCVKFEYLIEI